MADTRTRGFPKMVAAIGSVSFLALGLWAMAAPRAFFDSLARFEPYNQHFVQDIGAFQIGLGAVLLLATMGRADPLATGLLGVGAGSTAHVVSHVIGRDLGGKPARDLALFAIFSAVLLLAGWIQRDTKRSTP